jgi:hypothetical protein
MSPFNAAICTTISYTRVEWYYLKKTIIWPRGQRSRSHEGHYGTWHTALWSCTHIPNIIALSRKTKNVMARTRKYYLKNNYLTLRSKVKVPRRSLWYATHRPMVMHPHTKYNWPIWKDKKVMVRTSFAEKKQKKWKKKIRLKQYVSLRSKGRHNKCSGRSN